MARYRYDVDKITRLIDVHKSFQGGLKTVDTDEALKDFYLREAENISLSEFSFVEKRYGLHSNADHKPWSSIEDASSKLQGYFEYYVDTNTVHKIIAFEGRFYIDQGSDFEEVTLFDTPTGEAIDLSSLGIYTNADIELSWESDATFGTKVPWYYTAGSPNGVISGVSGDIIQGLTYFYTCNGGTSWTQGSAAPTFPFVTNLLQGSYYKDTRTDKIYEWENVDGYDGKFTLKTDIYDADFQTTRPVEGVRIDDKLYIATGTYPVYYKGDGKIYVFPQYEMSDLDIANLGYDLNNINLEAALTNLDITEDTSQGATFGSEDVSLTNPIFVKQKQWTPRIPYVGNTLKFEIAYHLYNDVDTWDYDFDSTGGITETSGGSYGSYTQTGGAYIVTPKDNYKLYPRVYRKPAGAVYSAYEQITDINFITLTNDENTAVTSRSEFDQLPLNASDAISNMEITVLKVDSGYWDYRVDMVLEVTGFRPLFGFAIPTVSTSDFKVSSVEYPNIWVTPEELVDYQGEPYDTLKVHTCNRITEHNGRLCLFGSTTHPDWLFFSTAGAKEYFPYGYALQFTNDLQEEITAVTKFMNILVVQSPSYTWGIRGDVPLQIDPLEGETYRKITINPTIGCIAPKSVKNVRNQVYFLSKEGIFSLRALYAEDSRYNVDPIDRNIYNIVPRDTDAVAAYYDDQYWLHFPQDAMTLRYYVDKKAWVKDTYSAWNVFGGIHKYINESGVLRFITDLSQFDEGDDLKVFDVDVDYSLPTDLTKNIESKITTSYLNQDYPFHPKNYKEAKLDFAIQNEYNTAIEELPLSNGAQDPSYIEFDVTLIDRHFYSITFEDTEVTAPAAYTVEIDDVEVASGTVTTDGTNLSTIRFMSNKTGTVTVRITIANTIADGEAVEALALYDSTYDQTVTFNTMVLSEEGTLNIDPIASYTSADVAVPIELGTRLGNWTFGTTNFGNVIVAIKTIKLSGRGYNAKVSIIENSKSKWTLESIGITYKMKKARSK